MRLLPIIDLLKAQCPLLEGRVSFVDDLMDVNEMDVPENVPQAWLGYIGSVSGKNSRLKGVLQESECNFVILIAAPGSDANGEPLVDILQEIEQAIFNRVPAVGQGWMQHVSDEVLKVSLRILWWQGVYKFAYLKSNS